MNTLIGIAIVLILLYIMFGPKPTEQCYVLTFVDFDNVLSYRIISLSEYNLDKEHYKAYNVEFKGNYLECQNFVQQYNLT